MGSTKRWSVQMSDEQYCSLPFEERQKFLSERAYYTDEHKNLYETDPVYREAYKTHKAVKKDLEDYKFKKRHANNTRDFK